MRKPVLFAGAAACFALFLFFPTGWYDAIPRQAGLAPLPIRGVTLLRLTFLLEALILVVVAVSGRSFSSGGSRTPLAEPDKVVAGDISRSFAIALVALITLLALVLRIIAITSDLWIDEITPLLDYGSLSIAHVVGSYLRSNNHLLNTLLVKSAVAVFGEHEWSVRLPAVVFGVASIPAIYWVGRLALSRTAASGAALMLATSYHHIFFSQNARGYTAYLFFALLSAGALVRALNNDRGRLWALYVTSVVLGFASLITTAFVFAAQGIVGIATVATRWRDRQAAATLALRLVVVCAVAGLLSFQLYATSLPEAYVVINSVYLEKGTGFQPLSLDFVNEIVRGVTAGFLGVPAAIAFVAIGALGFAAFVAASWQLATAMSLPLVLVAASLAARGLTFSPRFFLLGVPLAILSAMAAGEAAVSLSRRKLGLGARGATVATAALAVAISGMFAASLPYYYSVPKQPYRAALQYVERSVRPGGMVAIIYTAEAGFRYYVPRAGVRDPEAYRYVRTRPAMDSLLAASTGTGLLVVTTLPRMLGLDLPGLSARIDECCEPVRTFPGTLGDGHITVWRMR